ncbi:hypothetical protein ACOMHN_012053 [Nucella lapillus]
MDFSVQSLEGLGQAERIRLCRQLRRKQVENYLEFVSRELASQADPPRPLPRKPNSRGTQAHFHGDVCLQTAVEETDEREVPGPLTYLQYLAIFWTPDVPTVPGHFLPPNVPTVPGHFLDP